MSKESLLKRLRTALKLSQAQVAEAVGVSQPNYQRWEAGSAPVPADKLARLAKVLHSTTDVLAGRARYARVDISRTEDGDLYWGEAAIHFRSGVTPVVVSVTVEERGRLLEDLQNDPGRAFVEVRGLCNEHYLIRRAAISEFYLSDEASDYVGVPDYPYADHLPLLITDGRLWDVIANVALESEYLDHLPREDVVEALSYFMAPQEIGEYLESDDIAPAPPLEAEIIDAIMADKMGMPSREWDHQSEDLRALRRAFLLPRAARIHVSLATGEQRQFLITEPDDFLRAYENMVDAGIDERRNVLLHDAGEAQMTFFPVPAIDAVRLPAHLLARAADGLEFNF